MHNEKWEILKITIQEFKERNIKDEMSGYLSGRVNKKTNLTRVARRKHNNFFFRPEIEGVWFFFRFCLTGPKAFNFRQFSKMHQHFPTCSKSSVIISLLPLPYSDIVRKCSEMFDNIRNCSKMFENQFSTVSSTPTPWVRNSSKLFENIRNISISSHLFDVKNFQTFSNILK